MYLETMAKTAAQLAVLRKNAAKGGRKPGKKLPATIEREKVLLQVRNRIARNADRIVSAQMSLALGQQFLFKIETYYAPPTSKGGKPVKKQTRPKIVTSATEIKNYLDGQYDVGDDYYFITTQKPDNQAIKDMLDRTFGRPVEQIAINAKIKVLVMDI